MDGELDAADWVAFRDEMTAEQDAAKAEADRLLASEAEVERTARCSTPNRRCSSGSVISEAPSPARSPRDGVDAVRAALTRLFSVFVLHPQQSPKYDGTGRSELVDVDAEFMIELVVHERALVGYDERLLPILRREPLYQAENKDRIGFPMR